ncbi:MAG: 2-phosphoglycolate phosphatase [Gammaproteobacteria bacterium]|jgi:2-phosphoglycolate phosphatase
MLEAILFDLDGTLVDTAPDMSQALNNLLIEEGWEPLPRSEIRPWVSQGGLALTQLGFDHRVNADQLEPLRLRFLNHYRKILADESRLFDGFETILDQYEQASIPWGIITNKPGWLTAPLLEALGLTDRSSVTLSGDSLTEKKPHPMPILEATRRLNVNPKNCVYIGDDERDMIACVAAGMPGLIAEWGYLGEKSDPSQWGADDIIELPQDLLQHSLTRL